MVKSSRFSRPTDGGCVLVPSQEPRYKRRDCQAIAWERCCDHLGMSKRDACSTWLLVWCEQAGRLLYGGAVR